ncbi:hypothetical protein GRO01_02070 [Gluconobacter roseus NBRC 3990]|uniref:Amidase domain-containing protein n=1 Tax=Gluconobacter roseus NBRC 3990 TaxID=1307950 RepID=A0A4Y3M5S6_9PROT|nr:hypothetical protein AA3990_0758 [Gluconobacter roseus NBRC 3990]GEB02631.1 hypothetical protein GRO01_02070 [Gluconobacter roseus NBRC 3990]GLP93090.1 hypothetical protein GCM10007871_10680 [Gluconobacter roseus NBRC 3990]
MSENTPDTATVLLARIERHEASIQAFSSYDPVRLRHDAGNAPKGPLSGLSVGVKDIIDTAYYPTAHGSPIYAGHHTPNDAACVTQLKAAGALCVGKTVTTEFAFFRAGPTVNPYDFSRTPGGVVEWLGGGCGSRHDRYRAGVPDGGFSYAACILLRRSGVQTVLWTLCRGGNQRVSTVF